MKKETEKRMILKGKFPCILTAGENVHVEWLREKTGDPIYLFLSPTEYAAVNGGKNPLPAEKIIAAAVGEDFHTKGQTEAFEWEKAKEHLRTELWMRKNKEKTAPQISAEQSLADAPVQQPAEEPPLHLPRCPFCAEGEVVKVHPFPKEFPQSVWYRYQYASPTGNWHYLTGTIYRDGKPVSSATAVPGKNSMRPPAWLKEFSVYLKSEQNGQGYWIAVSPFISGTKTEEET